MPFNHAIMGVGGRTFILAITAEDLAINYDVEAEVLSAFPTSGGTVRGDVVQLSVAAVDLVAASATGYAIDGDGLHDDAKLFISLTTGAWISGRGGKGGNGGKGEWTVFEPPAGSDTSTAGSGGSPSGRAIRFGCETHIIGTGDIERGYEGGGGGGGGAINASNVHGGGGGGGGAPLGLGGSGGIGQPTGSAGGTATNTADGGGGLAGGAEGGNGGRGGDSVAAGATGSAGTTSGGSAGSVREAITTQGFTNTIAGTVTVTGAVT